MLTRAVAGASSSAASGPATTPVVGSKERGKQGKQVVAQGNTAALGVSTPSQPAASPQVVRAATACRVGVLCCTSCHCVVIVSGVVEHAGEERGSGKDWRCRRRRGCSDAITASSQPSSGTSCNRLPCWLSVLCLMPLCGYCI